MPMLHSLTELAKMYRCVYCTSNRQPTNSGRNSSRHANAHYSFQREHFDGPLPDGVKYTKQFFKLFVNEAFVWSEPEGDKITFLPNTSISYQTKDLDELYNLTTRR